MSFDINEFSIGLVQAVRAGEKVDHFWLYGIHYIIQDKVLDKDRVEEYAVYRQKQHNPFTKIKSSVQMMKLASAFSKQKDITKPIHLEDINIYDIGFEMLDQSGMNLFNVHLPVNDSYHFEFPLVFRFDDCRFVYTKSSQDICEPQGFPQVRIRESLKLGKEAKGVIKTDNKISANSFCKNGIENVIEGYRTMQELVNYAQKN